jgi:hypothetical protein
MGSDLNEKHRGIIMATQLKIIAAYQAAQAAAEAARA